MTFKLPDGCIEALGIAALFISAVFLSIGFYIAFLRKCDEKTSIKLPFIGYLCKENIGIAFVRHMLANDFYDEGKAATSEAQRKDLYTRAYCQSELLMKIYPGGFTQFTPTSVIRSETSVELKKDSGGDQPSCGT